MPIGMGNIVARISVMVGHVTLISGGGGVWRHAPPRKFLNFKPHESHSGVISNSEITLYNHKVRYAHIAHTIDRA